MGLTLLATLVVYPTSILANLGLASTIIIISIEFHAYVNFTIGVVPVVTIIAVVIVATSTTFKQPMGQVLSGHLLSVSC